jgi:hypothetical protein
MLQIEASYIYCDLKGVPDIINPKATQVILKSALFFVHLFVSSPHTGVMSNSPLGFTTALDKIYVYDCINGNCYHRPIAAITTHCVVLSNPIFLNKQVSFIHIILKIMQEASRSHIKQ